MISQKKLSFWINNNYNVLFVGRHGVGKSSVVKQAFDNAKLNWLYFSAATMDPWVDLVGVPKERQDESGNSYLDLVRPKAFQDDTVEAIFFDEFNRCLTGDTLISLASGESIPIKDLIGREKFYVYSYDKNKEKIVIGKGHSARKTGKNQKVIEVTLDNGKKIKCTEDHPFLLRSGTYRNAGKLKVGDSLMPLYRRLSENKKLSLNGYEEVYQVNTDDWEFTHRIADQYNLDTGVYETTSGKVRHHVDYNKLNNSPENILRVGWTAHKFLHKNTGSSGSKAAHRKHPNLYERTIGRPESLKIAIQNSIITRRSSLKYKKLRSKLSKNNFNTPEKRKKQSERCKKQWKDGCFSFNQKEAHHKRAKTIAVNFGASLLKQKIELTEKLYLEARRKLKGSGKSPITLDKVIKYFGSFDKYLIEVNQINKIDNHKVTKIKDLGFEDVYDISVDDYFNFALDSGVFVHNSHKKIRNAVMELIQFKSINGKKFENLKIVWAAINPDDDEDTYDVDRLDPAQEDRFHIKVTIPYKLDRTYFVEHYGVSVADAAIEWWDGLSKDLQSSVSPRRLDYALDVLKNNGDIRDVLPRKTGVAKLLATIKTGPIIKTLTTFFKKKDKVGAATFLQSENVVAVALEHFNNSTTKKVFVKFFLPLLSNEKLAVFISGSRKGIDTVVDLYSQEDNIKKVVGQIIAANQNKSLVNKIKRKLKYAGVVHKADKPITTKPEFYYAVLTESPSFCNSVGRAAKLVKRNSSTTVDRRRDWSLVCGLVPKHMTLPSAHMLLSYMNSLASRSQTGTLCGFTNFFAVLNHTVKYICDADKLSTTEFNRQYGKYLSNIRQDMRNSPKVAGQITGISY